MRRSALFPFLMVVGLVVLMLAWRTLSIGAQSIDCFRGCRKDEKPPQCCTPPPCSFWQELKIAKATVNIYSKAARLPAGDFVAELLKLRGMKSCSDTATFRAPEPMEISTDGKCRIGIYEREVFKEQ